MGAIHGCYLPDITHIFHENIKIQLVCLPPTETLHFLSIGSGDMSTLINIFETVLPTGKVWPLFPAAATQKKDQIL